MAQAGDRLRDRIEECALIKRKFGLCVAICFSNGRNGQSCGVRSCDGDAALAFQRWPGDLDARSEMESDFTAVG